RRPRRPRARPRRSSGRDGPASRGDRRDRAAPRPARRGARDAADRSPRAVRGRHRVRPVGSGPGHTRKLPRHRRAPTGGGVAGCETVEAAAALVGRLVALPEAEALPLLPGQFYPWQLEGCRVSTEDGREVGRVIRIEQSAAQDLWVVSDGARECLIPAVAEIVLEVDVAAGRVVIRPPDGLLAL